MRSKVISITIAVELPPSVHRTPEGTPVIGERLAKRCEIITRTLERRTNVTAALIHADDTNTLWLQFDVHSESGIKTELNTPEKAAAYVLSMLRTIGHAE